LGPASDRCPAQWRAGTAPACRSEGVGRCRGAWGERFCRQAPSYLARWVSAHLPTLWLVDAAKQAITTGHMGNCCWMRTCRVALIISNAEQGLLGLQPVQRHICMHGVGAGVQPGNINYQACLCAEQRDALTGGGRSCTGSQCIRLELSGGGHGQWLPPALCQLSACVSNALPGFSWHCIGRTNCRALTSRT